jgi:hypothetical protein
MYISGTYDEGRRGAKRDIKDIQNARIKIKEMDAGMANYLKHRKANKVNEWEDLIQLIAASPSINPKTQEKTLGSVGLTERLADGREFTCVEQGHIHARLRMMYGDVNSDLALFKNPATPAIHPATWLIAMYSMHIINSLQKYCWNVLKNHMGIWNNKTKKMEQNLEAVDRIIAKLKAKKQGKHLYLNIMNGRDWRTLFTQAFELMLDVAQGHPMLTWTASLLKKALEYMSWLSNTSDSISDLHIAIMECSCHVLDLTLDVLDPKHKARHQAKDHFHVAIHHYTERMTATRVPFLVTEEGVFEAALKSWDKKWLPSVSMQDTKRDLKQIVGLAEIYNEGAIRYWLTNNNPKDVLPPSTMQSFIFLPCCFTTTKQQRTMIYRCTNTIAYYPQERFWTWATLDTNVGMFVRMQVESGQCKLTPICVCPGSTSTPYVTCEWLIRQNVDDVVANLNFQSMRSFVDNINRCGESKSAAATDRRKAMLQLAKNKQRQSDITLRLSVLAKTKQGERKVRRARKNAVLKPLEQRVQRLDRDTDLILHQHRDSKTFKPLLTVDITIIEQVQALIADWITVSSRINSSSLMSSALDDIAVTADEQRSELEKFLAYLPDTTSQYVGTNEHTGTEDDTDTLPMTVDVATCVAPRTPRRKQTRGRCKRTAPSILDSHPPGSNSYKLGAHSTKRRAHSTLPPTVISKKNKKKRSIRKPKPTLAVRSTRRTRSSPRQNVVKAMLNKLREQRTVAIEEMRGRLPYAAQLLPFLPVEVQDKDWADIVGTRIHKKAMKNYYKQTEKDIRIDFNKRMAGL